MPHQMTPRFAPQLRVYPKHKLNAQASVTGRDTRGWLDREPLKAWLPRVLLLRHVAPLEWGQARVWINTPVSPRAETCTKN